MQPPNNFPILLLPVRYLFASWPHKLGRAIATSPRCAVGFSRLSLTLFVMKTPVLKFNFQHSLLNFRCLNLLIQPLQFPIDKKLWYLQNGESAS